MADAARALVFSLLMLVAAPACAAAQVKAGAVPACPSLANLRILIQRGRDDLAAAGAVLSDAKADHLGCLLLDGDRIASTAERIALGGREYECFAIQGTSVCHWVVAGSVAKPGKTPPASAGKPRR